MEEDPVPGVQEQHERRQQCRSRAERPCGEEPGDDRPRVEHRHDRLGEGTPGEVEQPADREHRQRRAPEDVSEVDRVRLEQLDVAAEIGAEIPSFAQRDDESLEPPDGERDEEDDAGPAAGPEERDDAFCHGG